MKTTTIKEVYEQCLANGWLGTEKACIVYGNKYTILCCKSSGSIVIEDEEGNLKAFYPTSLVQWIGNQPKKKMLYAAMVWLNGHNKSSQIRWYSDKKDIEHNSSFIKWMDEDKYPPEPIEIEGDE